jgi:HK97 family phage major capsid protein/HK97 family phage prohead protease
MTADATAATANLGRAKWDPDGDGDDDSTPEGDTDNSHWDSGGKPILAAWMAAGKTPPVMHPENASEPDGETRDRLPREDLVRAISGCEVRDAPAGDPSPGTMTGHLAVFNQWSEISSIHEGHFMERLAPGAFDKTLEGKSRMKVTFNHGKDPHLGDKVLGIPTVLEPDDHGVKYEVPLFDTEYNRELAPGLKAGAYGSSFRFNVVHDDFNKRAKVSDYNPKGLPERTLTEVNMQEFGPVTFPAYPGATSGMRSLTDKFVLGRFLEDPGKLAPLVDSIVDGSQHSDTSRGTQSALAPAEPKQAVETQPKPRRLKPVEPPKTDISRSKPMTKDERRDRITELETWIRDTNESYQDDAMPDEVRLDWDKNNDELDQHRKVVAELEARDKRVAELAAIAVRNGSAEAGTSFETRVNRGTFQQINRMSEGEVYDLESLTRSSFMNPEQLNREITDRAKRAVEMSRFPHERANLEFTQGHIEDLLNYSDGPGYLGHPEIARRILVTGGPRYHRAFHKYLANQSRTPDEERALSLGAGASGGFQVVYQLDPTIIPTSNLSVNPYREIANVETITGTNEWRGVTSTGVTASYGSEGQEATDGTPALLQPAIVVQTANVFIPFSIQYGQDVGNVEGQMAGLIQDAKDDLEAVQFTTGLGTGVVPQGVVVGATTTVSTASGGTFAIADVYAMENALGPRFRPRASWVMNRTLYNLIRAFDTAGGAGMWIGYPNPLQGGMQNNVPRSGRLGINLLAYPTYECSAVDTAITTTHLDGILGDFSYYKIIDRLGLDIEIAPMLFGAANRFPTGQRGLYAYWRNSAKVLAASAFRVLKIQ